ncbi:B3 domain-containing protein Os01g0234100-like [Euphorbia lathyris]|uniref:B3 domain-containing protein Os01g0234100-like n=1 Tax=Euphorbia lathyris TaxID=212925 RepID=UPI003313B997
MASSEEPNTPPSQSSPLLRQFTIYSHPKVQKRKSLKRKQTQEPEDSPQPNHREDFVLHDKLEKSGMSTSNKQKRSAMNGKTGSKSSTMERAEEIVASLGTSCPSFAKTLVRSNVTVGFWMHLPMKFCKSHMPKHDAIVNVETESGEYVINYISDRTALSGGWKAFCAIHKLHEGDVLVFHLVQPLRFKVHIVREARSPEIETVDATMEENNSGEEDVESSEKTKSLDLLGPQEEKTEDKSLKVAADKMPITTQSENGTENHDSKTLDTVVSSESAYGFKDVDDIRSFSIIVNGLAIDSEISDHHRTKYYQLCRSQSSFLHDNLLESINNKLAAEIIVGTVNISEGIRASKLGCSHSDFAVWDKTLKGFELLGMDVGFLRSRLDRLMNLAAESEEAVESECRKYRLEQARIDEEMRSLEAKLTELKEARRKLEDEIETLKVKAESQEKTFRETVDAPW